MQNDSSATVFRVFLAIIIVFVGIDVVALARSQVLAALPLVFQSAVLMTCLLRLRIAVWFVRIWAILMIVVGLAYWASVLLQFVAWAIYPEGGPIVERITKLTTWGALTRTFVLALGAATLKFVTRDVLQARRPEGETAV